MRIATGRARSETIWEVSALSQRSRHNSWSLLGNRYKGFYSGITRGDHLRLEFGGMSESPVEYAGFVYFPFVGKMGDGEKDAGENIGLGASRTYFGKDAAFGSLSS